MLVTLHVRHDQLHFSVLELGFTHQQIIQELKPILARLGFL